MRRDSKHHPIHSSYKFVSEGMELAEIGLEGKTHDFSMLLHIAFRHFRE
jgi:hypothetical protein